MAGPASVHHKTKMCSFFSAGTCSKGVLCNFVHDPRELNPKLDLRCTKLCPTLLRGGECALGRCTFAHHKEDLRKVHVSAPSRPQQQHLESFPEAAPPVEPGHLWQTGAGHLAEVPERSMRLSPNAPMLLARIGGMVQQVPVKGLRCGAPGTPGVLRSPQKLPANSSPMGDGSAADAQQAVIPSILPSPHKLPMVGWTQMLDSEPRLDFDSFFLGDASAGRGVLRGGPGDCGEAAAAEASFGMLSPLCAIKRAASRLSRQSTGSTCDGWRESPSDAGGPDARPASSTSADSAAATWGPVPPFPCSPDAGAAADGARVAVPLPPTPEGMPAEETAGTAVRGSLRERLYKTKMCSFHLTGKCRFNAQCKFAHNEDELKPAPDFSRTRRCPMQLETGRCSDSTCRFAHSDQEQRSLELPAGSAAQGGGGGADVEAKDEGRAPVQRWRPSALGGDILDDCVETMMRQLSIRNTFIEVEDATAEPAATRRSKSAPATGRSEFDTGSEMCFGIGTPSSDEEAAASFPLVSPCGTRKMPFRRHVASKAITRDAAAAEAVAEPAGGRRAAGAADEHAGGQPVAAARSQQRPRSRPVQILEPRRMVSAPATVSGGECDEALVQLAENQLRRSRPKTLPEAALKFAALQMDSDAAEEQ